MTKQVFLGLDGEMTGGRGPLAHKTYQLVELGLATFNSDGLPDWDLWEIGYDQIEQDPEAMAVHGISVEQIKQAPRAPNVDRDLDLWLERRGIRKAVPVGWNVGQFDMPFVREYLPQMSRRISRRSVDLNGIMFTVAEITGRTENAVKAASKKYAEKQIKAYTSFEEPAWHDAAYDALAALYAWTYFQQILVVRETHDYL